MCKKYDIVVIGAGAGGLVVAIGAAKAFKKVLLIDKGTWGGDCTNFGCIPSKALIAASHAAHAQKEGERFGLKGASPFTENAGALERVRNIIEEIKSHEDPASLKKLGVETLTGSAHFVDAHHIALETGETVYGKQIVIATGSSPQIPEIEGLDTVPYLTNETIFELKEIPKSLCVVGGGPLGCELAQAFSRLGAKVSQVHSHRFLVSKEDKKASRLLTEIFRKEGLDLHLGEHPKAVTYENGKFALQLKTGVLVTDVLLVASGRRPNVDALGLLDAQVKYSSRGIPVDKYGRTNKKHIWAVGDVTGKEQFTHAAENQARNVLQSLLLPLPKKQDLQFVPRVTYTDPEIASFGLSEESALEKFGKKRIATYHVPFDQVDRAITASRTEGFVRVVTKKWSSQILGATIVGPRAGEMLPELSLAALHKIPLRKLARLVHPYPTYNHAIRKAADMWLTQTILPALKKLVRR